MVNCTFLLSPARPDLCSIRRQHHHHAKSSALSSAIESAASLDNANVTNIAGATAITINGDPNTNGVDTAYPQIVYSASLTKIPRTAYTAANRETPHLLAEGALLQVPP